MQLTLGEKNTGSHAQGQRLIEHSMLGRLTGPDQSSPGSQTAPHPQPQSDSVHSKEQQVSLDVRSLQCSGKRDCAQRHGSEGPSTWVDHAGTGPRSDKLDARAASARVTTSFKRQWQKRSLQLTQRELRHALTCMKS